MNYLRTILFWALLVVASGSPYCAFSQTATTRALPPLPKYQSPVEFFRKLLAATQVERAEMLKNHSDARREIIVKKIEEYTILPPPVREWRLKATELRYYLVPLMSRSADERGNLVNMIPEKDRGLVESRLRQWDKLPLAEREAMLNSQLAIRYLARPTKAPTPSFNLDADPKHQKLASTVSNWQRLSAVERESITKQFNSFFDLSRTEKNKTIAVITGIESERLRQTVRSFEGMSNRDRDRCIVAMKKIVRMSDGERMEFLKNVDRWKSLSEGDRRQWRTLVAKVPPLPPGFTPAVR